MLEIKIDQKPKQRIEPAIDNSRKKITDEMDHYLSFIKRVENQDI